MCVDYPLKLVASAASGDTRITVSLTNFAETGLNAGNGEQIVVLSVLKSRYAMNQAMQIKTINEYNAIVGYETLHPLVSMIDLSRCAVSRSTRRPRSLEFGFYAVFLKQGKHCEIRYGRNTYDYQEGTLVFIAPGQVVSIEEDGEDYQPEGFALLFHPDLLKGTALGNHMREYSFFSYSVHEALHLSAQERQIVLECFRKIEFELRHAIDKHSKKLVVSNLELFLNYCTRFYDRQFITRFPERTGVLEKFETLLNDYYQSDKPQQAGLPSVAYFARECHLSSGYFGDFVKKETGKTALEFIQLKLMDIARERIHDPSKSISEIAFELGFKYPQHFTRFFKQQAGMSPMEYRGLQES